MTREEAIKCIQEEKLRYERAPLVNSCPMMEEWQTAIDICDMAISALRQQEQESNEPLTLDELRQMEGKPVWAIDGTGTAAYILIDADGNGIDTDSGFWDADYYGMTKDGKPGLHRMGWLAYRHQLKNTTEG